MGAGSAMRGQPAPTASDNAVGVELRVLGPVEGAVGGVPVDLGSPKQRAVFALLLSRIDRPVAVDTLIEELWSGVWSAGCAGCWGVGRLGTLVLVWR